MANETEFSNFTTVAAYVAANVAPHFRDSVVTEPWITVEEPTPGSSSKKFNQRGSLTANVTSESAAATKSEYTENSVTLTLQKAVVYVELSHEAESYQSGSKLQELVSEAGMACAEKFDADALALAAGFSTSVGSTGVDSANTDIKTAAYNLRLAKQIGQIAAFLHPTQVNNIGDDIIASTTVVHGTPGFQELLDMQPKSFEGRYLGIPIFSSTNVPSANANADWLGLMCSKYAIAALKKPTFTVNVGYNVASSLHELAVIMDYQVGEWQDEAGVGILGDQ